MRQKFVVVRQTPPLKFPLPMAHRLFLLVLASPRGVVLTCVFLLGIGPACQQRPPSPPTMALPAPGSGGGGAPPPPPGPSLTIRLSPDMHVNLNWLEFDEFFPPGARRVGPDVPLGAKLLPVNRTAFPSTELCTSPDKHHVLFHDGMKRKERGIHHWLLLLKKDAPFPNTIFGTRTTFEASWAADSLHFAVTHFTGDNSSEVFVVDLADLERKSIDVGPLLKKHFSSHLVSVPLFMKAYRWTDDGRLVVRAMARAREEPYELFGCEAVVAFGASDEAPKVTFLRGFLKPQSESSAAAQP